MSSTSQFRCLVAVLALGFAVLPGCERKVTTPSAEQAIASLPWTNQFDHYRWEVLTGAWNHAESAWAKLRKERYSEEELNQWIRFQMEILEQTRNDALKISLRHSAMQQLYFNGEAVRPYLGWLKDGLRTNLFADPITTQHAQETVKDLERAGK